MPPIVDRLPLCAPVPSVDPPRPVVLEAVTLRVITPRVVERHIIQLYDASSP